MTLYRHFDSKDRLVRNICAAFRAKKTVIWSAVESARIRTIRRASARGWLIEAARNVSDPKSRGCALANAAVELPRRSIRRAA
jgi:AcrR family transcriptional regulator